ncbi:MAG: hypothetical protein AB1486_10190 [Planctomycetota bacterium]
MNALKGLGRLLGWSVVAALVGGGFYLVEQWRRASELEHIIERLSGETRVAQATVLDQTPGEGGALRTTVRFVPVDRNGSALRARDFTVEGDLVYFEALILKFDRELVKWGDRLRGKSLHLFRRAYGEKQAPETGFELEGPQRDEGVPEAYRAGGQASALERRLWSDFWHLASDPRAAEAEGVRVAQLEAVATRMRPGRLYNITLENQGGLNIVPAEWPPAVPRPPHEARD